MFISLFLPCCHSHPFSPHPATISASELSLADGRDRPLRRLDPGMMPLPDTAAGLEWSSLVNAAKAYEGRHLPPNPTRSPLPSLFWKDLWRALELFFFVAYSILFNLALCTAVLSRVQLCNPMDCSPRGSSVHGILRQEYWSGLQFPPPGDLPDSEIKTLSVVLAYGFFTTESPGSPLTLFVNITFFFFSWSNWAFF